MLKHCISTILFLWICTTGWAQDLIIKKSGDTVHAKILDVTAAEIQYLKSGQSNGSSYVLLKSAVKQISYSNGIVDSFVAEARVDTTALPGISDPYKTGVSDARKYYRHYRAAGTTVFFAGLISPIGGLIPAIACSATPPKIWNLDYPNPDLMANEHYANGYKQEARKIKQGSIWRSWGFTLGLNLVFAIFLLTKTH